MRLLGSNGCFDGRYIWLSSDQINAVYRVDTLKDYKLEYVCQFEEGAWGNLCRVIDLVCFNGHVYFVSSEGYEIWDMDIITLEMNHYKLINRTYKDYAVCCLIDDTLWIVPNSFVDPIVSFNLCTNCISQYDHIDEKWDGLDSESITDVVSTNQKLFFANRKQSEIHLFILDCSQIKGKTINTRVIALKQYESASCIFLDGENVGILGRTKKGTTSICMFDSCGELLKEYFFSEVYYPKEYGCVPYLHVLHIDDSFVFFPYHANDLFVYHEDNDITEKIVLPKSAQKALCGDVTRISRTWHTDSRIYCLSQSIPGVLFIELDKLEWIPFDIDKDSFDECFLEQLVTLYSTVSEEGSLLTLSEYIEYVVCEA